jgi:hypothetical protein
MATRPVLPRLTSTLTRSVMHHARPPRVPPLRNPHEPAAPRATEGASTAHPAHLGGAGPASTSSSTIGDGLTLHHSPPPTAPSYTTGVVPELLRWTSGQQVRLTGEEGAPLRKPRASAPKPQFEWTQDVKNKIMEMRAVGRTRSEVADE